MLGLALWLGWFLLGSVKIYEVSRQARLETGAAARDVSTQQSGRLVATRLEIGRTVRAGDVLAEFDAGPDILRAKEEAARLNAFPDKIADLRRQIEATQAAMDDDQRAATAAVQSATARQREASAGAEFARDNDRRMNAQSAAGGVAEVEALRATSDARKAASASDALAADARRIGLEARTRGRQAAAQIAELQRALVSLEADEVASRETLARLNLDIEAHLVRAPVDGVVGEVLAARAGAYLAEGQTLGQSAQMRLDGFPWPQYGMLDARVARVASEVRDGGVRVELVPMPDARLAPILRHGLSGRVEIQVDQVSPAVLLLRSAGEAMAPPAPTATSAPGKPDGAGR